MKTSVTRGPLEGPGPSVWFGDGGTTIREIVRLGGSHLINEIIRVMEIWWFRETDPGYQLIPIRIDRNPGRGL